MSGAVSAPPSPLREWSMAEVVNSRNKEGETALHLASRHLHQRYFALVVHLLEAGANAFIRNLGGQTAHDVAPSSAVRLLLKGIVPLGLLIVPLGCGPFLRRPPFTQR